MAEEEVKKPRRKKAPETVRERAEKDATKKAGTTKKQAVKTKIHRPLSKLRRASAKEYHPIKAPDNKAGRVMNKKVRFIPKFVRESWAELKLVTWPTKKEAASKTIAVIVFAAAIMIFVQILDKLFSQLVKEIILR